MNIIIYSDNDYRRTTINHRNSFKFISLTMVLSTHLRKLNRKPLKNSLYYQNNMICDFWITLAELVINIKKESTDLKTLKLLF